VGEITTRMTSCCERLRGSMSFGCLHITESHGLPRCEVLRRQRLCVSSFQFRSRPTSFAVRLFARFKPERLSAIDGQLRIPKQQRTNPLRSKLILPKHQIREARKGRCRGPNSDQSDCDVRIGSWISHHSTAHYLIPDIFAEQSGYSHSTVIFR
jgi:hypothetical protein